MRRLTLFVLAIILLAIGCAALVTDDPGCTTDSDCQARYGGNGDPD